MSTFSIGQINQLSDAPKATGYTAGEVKIQQHKSSSAFKGVLDGTHVIAPINGVKHIIDCDADPFVPEGLEIEEHIKGGKFEWDLAKIELYLHRQFSLFVKS